MKHRTTGPGLPLPGSVGEQLDPAEHSRLRRLAVELSIQTHGGPFLGCEECGSFEQQTLDPGRGEALEKWLMHLNKE